MKSPDTKDLAEDDVAEEAARDDAAHDETVESEAVHDDADEDVDAASDADEEDSEDEESDGDESDGDADETAEGDESEAAPMPAVVAEQIAAQSAAREQRNADDLRVLEALLFASSEPVSERVIGERLGEGADVPALLEQLRAMYQGRGVELLQGNSRWSFRTAPDVTERLRLEKLVPRKLSRAAIETLAIIAYHQPVTRAEIEEIRGVAVSSGTVDILLEEGWIKPRGRKEVPGRPVMWGTSNAFLDHFGLESLTDLPGIEELKASGLLDSRRGVSYATRGADTLLYDTDESDEAPEPLKQSGDEPAAAEEAADEEDGEKA